MFKEEDVPVHEYHLKDLVMCRYLSELMMDKTKTKQS
jgi:hypothetical protein